MTNSPATSASAMRVLVSLLCLAALLAQTGCATVPAAPQGPSRPAVAPTPLSAGEEVPYWWYSRFRLAWPDGEPAPWDPDLLLAHRVLRPILQGEGDQVDLWRFHRRARRDAAGRQFSFIYRATPATAQRIQARIDADPEVARLLRKGTLIAVHHDDPARPQRPGIGETSDPAWTPEMQRAWPSFIMGVSQHWLDLIHELDARKGLPRAADARYATINDDLEMLWRQQGGHALLHHLSAVFGYRELYVTSRGLLKL